MHSTVVFATVAFLCNPKRVIKERRVTDGARALRAWLLRERLNLPKFSDITGIDRILLQRACNGERRRISVDFAVRVERATSGAVPAHLWESATGVLVGDSEHPPSKTGTDS